MYFYSKPDILMAKNFPLRRSFTGGEEKIHTRILPEVKSFFYSFYSGILLQQTIK
jgi:hypothetical protein